LVFSISLAGCLPAPVQLSSCSAADLVSEVAPFFTAPAVVLTILAGSDSFGSLRVQRIVSDRRRQKFCFLKTPPELGRPSHGMAHQTHAAEPPIEPPTDGISVEPNLTNVCFFAHPFAELVAPPTMDHQAETPATVIADLMLGRLRVSHYARARRLRRVP
jgi:hypothetical protein